jgi:hypothetical protein
MFVFVALIMFLLDAMKHNSPAFLRKKQHLQECGHIHPTVKALILVIRHLSNFSKAMALVALILELAGSSAVGHFYFEAVVATCN